MARTNKRRNGAGMLLVVACAACGPVSGAMGQSLFRAPLPPPAVVTPTTSPGNAMPPVAPAATPSAPPAAPSATPASAPAPSAPANGPGDGSGGAPAAPTEPALPVVMTTGSMMGMAPGLNQVSLFAVVPPPPRTYAKHDKVEIIINESSLSQMNQKLDTKKSYDLRAELQQFPSFAALLNQLELRNGIDGSNTPEIGITNSSDFKSEGKYTRSDTLSARVSALVLEVKPNGLLLVEAKEVTQNDDEIKTLVLTGLADPKDITRSNTIQSSQLANLAVRIRNEGDVKNAGSKGLIPRVLEQVFNF